MVRGIISFFLVFSTFTIQAHEGMWLPTLLKSIEGDMHTAGLRITAEEVYSINHGSIKDAIVLFGGGCTAGIISDKGLILTNHHCGFSQIQEHSSLENDYLRDGFWSSAKDRELRNPGLTATLVVRMEDVSDRILPALGKGLTEAQRRQAIEGLSGSITAEAIAGTHYRAVVRPFNHGNSYYLIITETFRDVRLVGAPPSSIGKFGGDTDNWMWPRHNADFSLFRIYAGPDNLPADPSDVNVPYTPRHVLPISLEGVKEGDFAMIFGFPGNTQRYLSSYAVEHVIDRADPVRIAMRTASLEVIDEAMRSSDLTRIQYADKQSSISNAWKKWIGELRGLKELNTLENKRAYEEAYRAKAREQGAPEFAEALDALKVLYAEYVPYAMARDLFIEMVYYGPDVLRFADSYRNLIENYATLKAQGKLDAELSKLKVGAAAYFKDYDVDVDKRVFKALLPIFRTHIDPTLAPDILKEIDTKHKGSGDAAIEALYSRSVFVSAERLDKALGKLSPKAIKALAADPAFRTSRSFFSAFLDKVRPIHAELSDRIEGAMRTYVKGMMELYPEKTYWPDANSTLRLSYGQVEGSEPRDAVVYGAHSTLDGVVAKYIPGDAEFDVPQRLIELHGARDYGRYGINGTMPVCFTSSLHTTGGNSGSPVLNGRGELIGLNFDRTWESTMSDIQFDPDKCRNICVDARYILFIIDKFAGAGHLLNEMELVEEQASGMRIISIPLHR
jgi:hypothetical protein